MKLNYIVIFEKSCNSSTLLMELFMICDPIVLNIALLLQTVRTVCGIVSSFSPQCLEYDLNSTIHLQNLNAHPIGFSVSPFPPPFLKHGLHTVATNSPFVTDFYDFVSLINQICDLQDDVWCMRINHVTILSTDVICRQLSYEICWIVWVAEVRRSYLN